jgi:solute:Na+ symporter, SSS family
LSAVISQITIFIIYYFAIFIYPSGEEKLGYLWLNFIGAMLTIILSLLAQALIFRKSESIN